MSMYGVSYAPLVTGSKGGAKQSHRDECDINFILRRYERTGLLTPVLQKPGEFMDVSEVGDYRTALHNVRAADEYFMQLSSRIRAEFDNDPALFLDFVADPEHEERARELGLLPQLAEELVEAPVEAAPPGAGEVE